jgi:hypothetical protein
VSGISTVNGVAEGRAVSVVATGSLSVDQPIRTSPVSAAGLAQRRHSPAAVTRLNSDTDRQRRHRAAMVQ